MGAPLLIISGSLRMESVVWMGCQLLRSGDRGADEDDGKDEDEDHDDDNHDDGDEGPRNPRGIKSTNF